MMQKEGKRTRFLACVAFLTGLLIAIGGCSPAPEVSIVIPQDPAVELEPGDSAPLEAQVTQGEAVRVEWMAKCLKADDGTCQKALKDKEGTKNFITAPDRPGEQIIVSVVAVDSQGEESEEDTITVNVVPSTSTTEEVEPDCHSFRPPISGATDFAGEVKITSLENCSVDLPSGQRIPLAGTYSGNLEGHEIWILVYPPDLKFYPQSPDACKELPAQASGGRWATNLYLGREGVPEQFDIVVTVTDAGSEISQVFKDWLKTGCDTGKYPGISDLPDGLAEMDAITVKTK